MTRSVPDQWTAGATYEVFMGRWSRALAPMFVEWLCQPRGTRWLDVGCGTGALTSAILEHADPDSVLGCDPSAPFIHHARRSVPDRRASFTVAGAGSLPRHASGYGSVSSLFALNFFPDADAAIAEQRSLAAAGGTISACVWDYSEGMEFLRRFWDAAAQEDSAARALDEGLRFPICRPAALVARFGRAELTDVKCDALEIGTTFKDFDDYWRPFLGGIGPAPSYVASLDDARRRAMEKRLRASLPPRPDGTIALTARAWAVRGAARPID